MSGDVVVALFPDRLGFQKEYRMQVNVGSSTAWGKGSALFGRLVADETMGKIRIKPYYGRQLLKGAQLDSTQMVAAFYSFFVAAVI